MDKLKVVLNGVRDDGYTKKGETTRTERYIADVYLPGSGSLQVQVSREVYMNLLNVRPGADALLPFQIQQRAGTRSANGRSFGVMEDTVRFGNLELVAVPTAKAS